MSSVLTQIEELTSFLAQAATLCGKGSSSMTYDRAIRNTQICYTKTYAVEFANKHTRQEVSIENNNPQVIVADGLHEVPRGRASKRHLWIKINWRKEERVYRNIHVGLGRQLHEAELILALENADVPIDSSPPFGKELPKEKFLKVVVLAGLSLRKCHGWKGEISKNMFPLPKM